MKICFQKYKKKWSQPSKYKSAQLYRRKTKIQILWRDAHFRKYKNALSKKQL